MMNAPNGKSQQTFIFSGDQARHAIGTKHKKRLEFQSRPGIVRVEPAKQALSPMCYGFSIVGAPTAVDNLMTEMKIYLSQWEAPEDYDIYSHFKNMTISASPSKLPVSRNLY